MAGGFAALSNLAIAARRQDAVWWSLQALSHDLSIWGRCRRYTPISINFRRLGREHPELVSRRISLQRRSMSLRLDQQHFDEVSTQSTLSGTDWRELPLKQKVAFLTRQLRHTTRNEPQLLEEIARELSQDAELAKKVKISVYRYFVKESKGSFSKVNTLRRLWFVLPRDQFRKNEIIDLMGAYLEQDPSPEIVHKMISALGDQLHAEELMELVSLALFQAAQAVDPKEFKRLGPELIASVHRRLSPEDPWTDAHKHYIARSILKADLCDEYFEHLLEFNASPFLLTCCIDVLTRQKNKLDLILKIWNHKLTNDTASALDLHRIMTAYINSGDYASAIAVYDSNATLHDRTQYDVQLMAYAGIRDWDKLQSVFESIFHQNDMGWPSIEHYTIVMKAMSTIARTDIVELLYDGLQSRKLTPTVATLNAVLYSHLALGNTDKVEQLFNEEFARFQIAPNVASFTIMMHAYRDASLLSKALAMLHKMSKLSIRIKSHLVLPVIALCADRRDPEVARSLYRWSMETQDNKLPSLWIFNSTLNAIAQSHNVKDACEFYEERIKADGSVSIETFTIFMRLYTHTGDLQGIDWVQQRIESLKLKKDSKFFAAEMLWFGRMRHPQIAEIRRSFDEMSKQGVAPNAYHYTILATAHIYLEQYQEAIGVYEEAKRHQIAPTYKLHSAFIRAMSKIGPAESLLAEKLLWDFLQSPNMLDLTSNFLTRDLIPPHMFKPVMTMLLKTKKYESASRLIDAFHQQSPAYINDVVVLMLDIELRRSLEQWDLVDAIWTRIIAKIRGLLVRQTAADGRFYRVPRRYKYAFHRAINSKLIQLRENDKLEEADALIAECEELGLSLSSHNWNIFAQLKFSQTKSALDALKLAEGSLIANRMKWIHARKNANNSESAKSFKQPSRYLETQTIQYVAKNFRHAVEAMAEREQCSEEQARKLIADEYPQMMKAVNRQFKRNELLRRNAPVKTRQKGTYLGGDRDWKDGGLSTDDPADSSYEMNII